MLLFLAWPARAEHHVRRLGLRHRSCHVWVVMMMVLPFRAASVGKLRHHQHLRLRRCNKHHARRLLLLLLLLMVVLCEDQFLCGRCALRRAAMRRVRVTVESQSVGPTATAVGPSANVRLPSHPIPQLLLAIQLRPPREAFARGAMQLHVLLWNSDPALATHVIEQRGGGAQLFIGCHRLEVDFRGNAKQRFGQVGEGVLVQAHVAV